MRARASALGFASTSKAPRPKRRLVNRDDDDDDDDPYRDDDDDENSGDESNVDLDMLPTMLVYRDGELVHNWVRVDWEAGQIDIEELLDK